jgi:hypothetical protein
MEEEVFFHLIECNAKCQHLLPGQLFYFDSGERKGHLLGEVARKVCAV